MELSRLEGRRDESEEASVIAQRRSPRWAAAILATALLAAACGAEGESDSDSESFRVLFVSGETGMLSNAVAPVLGGVQAHVDSINEAGGINGRSIELIVKDNQSDPTRGATIIQDALGGDDKPDLVIPGVSSNEDLAAAPLLSRAEVVGMAPASSQLLDDVEKYPYFFSISLTTDPIVRAEVAFILGHPGVDRIALVVPDDAIGQATTLSYQKALEGKGVELAVESYKGDAVDVSPTFQKALSGDPDWILIEGAGSQAATLLSSRVKARAEHVPTMAGVVTSSVPLLQVAGEGQLENLYMTLTPMYAFVPEEERGPQMKDLLARATADGPLEAPLALYGYGWDMVGMWAEAVSSIDGEVTGPAIKQALETIDPDGKDPQFPLYSGGYSAESHFHEGPPEEFTFGTPIEMKDGMYVLQPQS